MSRDENRSLNTAAQATAGAVLMSPLAAQIVDAEVSPFLTSASRKRRLDAAAGRDPSALDRLRYGKYIQQNKVTRDIPYGVTYGNSPATIGDAHEQGGRKTIRQNMRGSPYLLHEAGHFDSTNPLSRARSDMLNWAQREIPNKSGASRYLASRGVHVADALMAPFDEAVAWRNAYKRSSGVPGPSGKRLRQMMRKVAVPSYLSNLPRAGMVGAGAYLLGDALIDIAREPEDLGVKELGGMGSAGLGAYLASRRGDNLLDQVNKRPPPKVGSEYLLSSGRTGLKPVSKVGRLAAPIGGALLGNYLFNAMM